MSAGWFKLPGFWSAKMGPQKVYSEFTILLCCWSDQLFVQVLLWNPFFTCELMQWVTEALVIHSIITSRYCWFWWGTMICTRVMLLLSCERGVDLAGFCTRGIGRLGIRERAKAFINKIWGRFKKRVIVKTMKSLMISESSSGCQ